MKRYIWKLTWAATRLYMSICKIVLRIIWTVNNATHGFMNNEERTLMTNLISGGSILRTRNLLVKAKRQVCSDGVIRGASCSRSLFFRRKGGV